MKDLWLPFWSFLIIASIYGAVGNLGFVIWLSLAIIILVLQVCFDKEGL